MRFVAEVLSNEIDIAETDLSAAKAQVDYLTRKLTAMQEEKAKIEGLQQTAERRLHDVLSEAVRRLDETADPETYTVSVSETGEVVALTRN